MWARKKIDIPAIQIIKGIGRCLSPIADTNSLWQIEALWPNTLPVLSVRSGFDLLMGSVDWPPGSEVLMSGLTILDMPTIVQEHQFQVVPVDLQPSSLYPSAATIKSKITTNTRAIVVAHLFGQRQDLSEIAMLAHSKGIMLIEDCAQAYCGNQHQGSECADVSMFSFGPIKTNTALGGGLIKVRDANLLGRLKDRQQTLPKQTNAKYAKRLLKYLWIKGLCTRMGTRAFYQGCRLLGKDHDLVASQLARSFPAGELINRIRYRPSGALLAEMNDRLHRYNCCAMDTRIRRAMSLRNRIDAPCSVVGFKDSAHWVFAIRAIRCPNRNGLVQHLWNNGFDATTRCSLKPISQELKHTNQLHGEIVFLPFEDSMPDKELLRMANCLNGYFAWQSNETSETFPQSNSVS